jgi:hypothetical protein
LTGTHVPQPNNWCDLPVAGLMLQMCRDVARADGQPPEPLVGAVGPLVAAATQAASQR